MPTPIEVEILTRGLQQTARRIEMFSRGVSSTLNTMRNLALGYFSVDMLVRFADHVGKVVTKYDDLFESQKKLGNQLNDLERGAVEEFQERLKSMGEASESLANAFDDFILILWNELAPVLDGLITRTLDFVESNNLVETVIVGSFATIKDLALLWTKVSAPVEVATLALITFGNTYNRVIEGLDSGGIVDFGKKLFNAVTSSNPIEKLGGAILGDGIAGAIAGQKKGIQATLEALKNGYEEAVSVAKTRAIELEAEITNLKLSNSEAVEEFAEKIQNFRSAIAKTRESYEAYIKAQKESIAVGKEQIQVNEKIAETNPKRPEDELFDGVRLEAREFNLEIKALADQYTNLGRVSAQVVGGAMLHAADALHGSIMGLITGTTTFQQAFNQMALSIISDLIAMAIKALIFSGFVNLGTYGTAAVAGAAALAAAIGVVMAAVGGAFAEGGLVSGGRKLIQVNERGEEFVMSNEAVNYFGEGFLSNMNDAAKRGGSGGGVGNVNVAPSPVSVAVLNDKKQLKDFMASKAGQEIIFETMNSRRLDFGVA